MSKSEIKGTAEAWENRDLGASEEHVKVSTRGDEASVNRALGLHPISIRLQNSLIDDLKEIAAIHGIGYQPLMRQVLNRFVEAEKKRILKEKRTELDQEQSSDCDDSNIACG